MKYYNDISAKVKKRVDLADASVNERRCLIENCPNERAVHHRHLINKKWAKDEKIVRFQSSPFLPVELDGLVLPTDEQFRVVLAARAR